MEATTQILGKLTLQGNITNALKGFQIDLYDTDHQVGWLAGTKVKSNGEFELYVNETTATTDYSFQISNKGIIFFTVERERGLDLYELDMRLSIYDAIVQSSKTEWDEENEYFIVRGYIKNFQDKPLVADIVINEVIYKDTIQIGATKSNLNGYFETKVSNKHFTNEITNCKRAMKVSVEIEGEVIAESEVYYELNDSIEINLKAPSEEIIPLTDYERIALAVNTISEGDTTLGALIAFSKDFDDIATYLSEASCIDLVSIRAYLLAHIYGTTTSMQPRMFFALILSLSDEKLEGTLLLSKVDQEARLLEAKSNHVITLTTGTTGELVTFLNSSITYKINNFLARIPEGEESTNLSLYEVIIPDSGDRTVFFNILFSVRGSSDDFWEELLLEGTFDETQISLLKEKIRLMPMTGFQPEIIARIIADASTTGLKSMGTLSVADWELLIDDVNTAASRICIPNLILNDDQYDDKVLAYATKLFDISHFYYPMQGFLGVLDRDEDIYEATPTLKADIITFINNNPEYSFRNITIEFEDSSAGFNFDDIVSHEELIPELRCLQRLASFTNSSPSAIAAFRVANILSASDVANMDDEIFAEQYSGLFGSKGATMNVYNLASKISGLSGIVAANMSTQQLVGQATAGQTVIGQTYPFFDPAHTTADPTLTTMFGTMDTCCCEHCRSVYSPTAYFTDLMNMLYKNELPLATHDVFDELVRRRPDLQHIDLTCVNANTPMPYIDLVIELLENKVLDLNTPDLYLNSETLPLSYQTSGDENDILSYPEHKVKNTAPAPAPVYIDYISFRSVYDISMPKSLSDNEVSVYPWVLPFNLAIEETRTYLKHLGYSRYDAMELLKPVGSFVAGYANDIAPLNIEIENHLLTPAAIDIIAKKTGYYSTIPLHDFYGIFAAAGSFDIVDPQDSSAVISFTDTGFKNELSENIHVLLQQLKITYNQLLQALTTEHLNPIFVAGPPPERIITIKAKAGKPDDTCVLKDLYLDFDSALPGWIDVFYDRLHRHVRLQKLTGWSIYEIDKAIRYTDTGTHTIDFSNIENILKLFRWSQKTGLDIERIQSFWNDLDYYNNYRDYSCKGEEYVPSLFDKLFKNKSVLNPIDSAFDSPTAFSDLYVDHKETIIAALKINDVLYKSLTAKLGINNFTVLDLEGLGRLQVLADIINYHKISFEELDAIWKLNGIDLSNNAAFFVSSNFEKILSTVHNFKSLKLPVDYIQYLLKNPISDEQYMPKEEDVIIFFKLLREQIKAKAKLHNVESPANLAALAGPELTALKADITLVILTEYGKTFNMIESPTVTQLCANYIQIEAIDTVTDAIIPALIANDPLNFFLTYTGNFTDAVTGKFDMGDTTTDPNAVITPPLMQKKALYYSYQFMYRISTFFGKFKINDHLFSALMEAEAIAEFGMTNIFDNWMDTESGAVTTPYVNVVNLLDWIKWRDENGISNKEMADFLMRITDTGLAITAATYAENMLSLIEGDNNLNSLFNVGAPNILKATGIPIPDEYYLGSFAKRIADINILNKKVGLNVFDIFQTLIPTVVLADSAKIRNIAKAKYDSKNWIKIAKPLQDTLREKQREALVAYLLARPNTGIFGIKHWRNENDLYAYFLIDVEMKPFSQTSRIKQALCSVQLFVDRVFMKLENVAGQVLNPTLKLSDKNKSQWKKWRKWYRIWEANRKVFLYPENWIEPELRREKTPLFEELETKLMQDEITNEKVENAMADYLEQMDEVGKLEPVTVLEERLSTNERIFNTHFFARTVSEPHQYYHRILEQNKYTPWKPIDIDIQGEQITAHFDRASKKVYLMWLKMSDNAKSPYLGLNIGKTLRRWSVGMNSYFGEDGLSGTVEEARRFLRNGVDIRLQWSEFKNGVWQRGKLSKEFINISPSNILTSYQTEFNLNNDTINHDVFNQLSNNKAIDLWSFFKSRLFINLKGEADNSVHVGVYMPYSMKEKARYIHGFYFPDMFSDPVVKKNTSLDDGFNAQEKTHIFNQKFVENKMLSSNEALLVNLVDNETVDHYVYIKFFDNISQNELVSVNNQPKHIGNQHILEDTPNGLYTLRYNANFNHFLPLSWSDSFYYYDDVNTYFVRNTIFEINDLNTKNIDNLDKWYSYLYAQNAPINWATGLETGFLFETFYHPYVRQYRKALNDGGVANLLGKGEHQTATDTMNFAGVYQPTSLVHPIRPNNKVDFTYSGAYSIYNWELFFHAPMLIANRLMQEQRFEEAQKWYHYIFDPTSSIDINGAPSSDKFRFWKFRPFYDETSTGQIITIQDMMANVNSFANQIEAWEQNPFEPHVLARLRIVAYMKNVVMKYLDNLIAWGDNLFSRDTIESINEATNLYILALNILGEKPQDIPPRTQSLNYTFAELLLLPNDFDGFSNIMVAIQNFIGPNATGYTGQGGGGAAQVTEMLYFCIPKNEKIMGYWKTIADRLFKIRNSMNIEGIQRLLPLYEPEIDPALLVKAVAAGLSMEKVMNEINGVGATNYRFAFMLQKANELCSDVKSLGGALLSALEKKDAEDLALLRSGQEINLLNQVKAIKELQLNEAESNLESALKTKEITELKQNYYIAQSAEYMNPKEKESQTEYKKGVKKQEISQGISATASVMSAIPNAHLQGVASGTSINISTIAKAASEVVGLLAYIHSSNSTLASTIAGYDRRRTDWNFQIETSKIELKQLEKQILSAEIRVQVAQKELDNHILQMENTQTNDAFMRSKYTNKQLYNWMVGEISATYFQSYKLAYDLARKAEATFKRELPVAKVPPTGIIQYGYWDSLKKGLLSGEKLQLDLRKLDLAYIENNKREFELTKHVSLANYSPESLMDLRDTGECSFNLSRDLFDLDFPGHYLRRIKSVSVSIPCIAGPYTTIPATLTYNKTGTGGKIRLNTGASPDLLETNIIERIATSSAQNDSGIFELNFRDERYVPFENLGVEDSDWSIELMTNANLRQFDYNTITDLIIHIKYTSRDGGDTEKGLVMTDISSRLTSQPILFYQLFSIKTMFANEWNKYLNDVDGGIGTPTLDIQLNHEKFPYFCMGKTIQLTSLTFELQTIDGESIADIDITDSVKTVDIANLSTTTNILTDNTLTGVSFIQGADLSFVFSLKTGGTQLTVGTLSKIRDLNFAVIYKLS